MKLYTMFTESHKVMYENYFLKSLPDEFDLMPVEMPQECPSGEFYKDGWDKTCYRKVELYYKACQDNFGDIIAFSDVDVQFFGNIKSILLEELGDFDIACQNDTANYYCSGFFIFRCNENTLKMFKSMVDNYVKEDQTTLNNHIHMVKSKFLSKKFFTIGHLLHTVWKGLDFTLPDGIVMHHSNWVEGIDNKIKLLDIVRKKVENNE